MLPPASEGWGERYCFQFVCQFTPRRGGGGYPIQPWTEGGGVPIQSWTGGVPQPWMGGTWSSLGWGGPNPVLNGGGYPNLGWGGLPHLRGVPPSKGENFWHQIWLDTCSDWKKFFSKRDPPQPPVKGKIFDTRFSLIHVQTGKKIFQRDPPTIKGKIFDTRFGLIHVQTGKKVFAEGPPPSKGKNFWHQIWLDTCSDWKKNFCRGTPPL